MLMTGQKGHSIRCLPGCYSADVGTTCNVISTCIVLALVAGHQGVSLDLTLSVSSRNYKRLSSAVKSAFLFHKTVNVASKMHVNACHRIAQPNITLLGWTLYLTQYL